MMGLKAEVTGVCDSVLPSQHDGSGQKVRVHYTYNPAVRSTADCPGMLAHIEITDVMIETYVCGRNGGRYEWTSTLGAYVDDLECMEQWERDAWADFSERGE